WLSHQPVLTYTQENKGGAFGFSAGIRLAYEQCADWIWIMDDDTIPTENALEQFVLFIAEQTYMSKIEFFSSLVLWTDGNVHQMNRTYVLEDKIKLAKLEISNDNNLSIIQFGTFVSMFLSSKAVEKIGLPIKEFFIWNDDVEYSKRIINSGLAGILVRNSIVIHQTPTNHLSNVFKDTTANLWKYNYGLRNELITKRSHEGKLQFWITWIHRVFIMPFRVILNRKDSYWPFIKVIWKSSFGALSFHPVIDTVSKKTEKPVVTE
ncbi:MAG: glycosyltransferase, partial [Pedobacter sp.]